jgi:hypothetical protein
MYTYDEYMSARNAAAATAATASFATPSTQTRTPAAKTPNALDVPKAPKAPKATKASKTQQSTKRSVLTVSGGRLMLGTKLVSPPPTKLDKTLDYEERRAELHPETRDLGDTSDDDSADDAVESESDRAFINDDSVDSVRSVRSIRSVHSIHTASHLVDEDVPQLKKRRRKMQVRVVSRCPFKCAHCTQIEEAIVAAATGVSVTAPTTAKPKKAAAAKTRRSRKTVPSSPSSSSSLSLGSVGGGSAGSTGAVGSTKSIFQFVKRRAARADELGASTTQFTPALFGAPVRISETTRISESTLEQDVVARGPSRRMVIASDSETL